MTIDGEQVLGYQVWLGGDLGADTIGRVAGQCPSHGAVFDVRDGRVRRGPARKPLRTYPVSTADGAVVIQADRPGGVA